MILQPGSAYQSICPDLKPQDVQLPIVDLSTDLTLEDAVGGKQVTVSDRI